MNENRNAFSVIYLVAGGIIGMNLTELDPVAGGLIPAFLGVIIFYGIYFIIRDTGTWFKAGILIILMGITFFVFELLKN